MDTYSKCRKKLNRLVVKDSYAADGSLKQLTQTFMTICPTDIQQPGKIFFDVAGKKVLMEYDANVWEVKKGRSANSFTG